MKFEDFKDHVKAEDPNRFGMVYLTLNKSTGDYYVGQHVLCQRCVSRTCDYLGSGVILRRAIDKYGKENFTRFCLVNSYSAKDLALAEVEKIAFYADFDGDMYNLHSMKQSKDHMFSTDYRNRIAEVIASGHRERWISSGLWSDSINRLSDEKLIGFHEEGYSLSSIGNKFKMSKSLLGFRLAELSSCAFNYEKGKPESCALNHRVFKKTFPFVADDELRELFGKEELHEMFITQKLSEKDIAQKFEISAKLVSRALKLYSIRRIRTAHNKRSIEELESLASKQKLVQFYLSENLSLEETSHKLELKKTTTKKLLEHYEIRKSHKLRSEKSAKTNSLKGRSEKSLDLLLPKADVLSWHNKGYTIAGISRKINTPRHYIEHDLKILGKTPNTQSMQTCYERLGRLVKKKELEYLFRKNRTAKAVSLELDLSVAIVMNLADHYKIPRIRRTNHG